MKNLWKKVAGISIALFWATLMAFSSSITEQIDIESDSVKSDQQQIQEIFFDEDCTGCRYITIYDRNDQLVLDQLVFDAKEIKDPALIAIIEKSYFLMRNSITDYYILSD